MTFAHKRILRLALLSLLVFCLTVPTAFAEGAAKTHGSVSTIYEWVNIYPPFTSQTRFLRYVASWKASEGVGGRPDSGHFTVQVYDYSDDYPFVRISNKLLYEQTVDVANVTRVDANTVQFHAPAQVVSPSESHYYSMSWYRAVDGDDGTELYWLCSYCEGEVWHPMDAHVTKVHVK